ncbi:MAG: capsid cement protein [Alphaproteobacteria bacterium]
MSLKTVLPIFALSVSTTVAVAYTQPVLPDGTVAGAGEAIVGLAQRDAENNVVGVTVVGLAVGTAGAAIAIGDELEVGADGKLVPLAAGVSVGIAMEAAAADGDKFSVLLK